MESWLIGMGMNFFQSLTITVTAGFVESLKAVKMLNFYHFVSGICLNFNMLLGR